MDIQAAFLSDIAANVEDDAPRLVYADWLDENGDPDRAQFIRVQCQLASMGQHDLERYDLEGPERAERLTYEQLGQQFGLTPVQVTNYLASARRQFRAALLGRSLVLACSR